MDINPNDLNVSQYNPNDRAGGWSLNSKTGVRIIHKPSGLEASFDMDRSSHKNRVEAMRLLQIKVDAWDAAGRPAPAGFDAHPVPNPNKVDFAQMRKDMDNGVLLCRDGILKALDFGIELQKFADGRALRDRPSEAIKSHKHGVVEGGKTGPVDACAATSITDQDEGGKRVASIDTNAKEQ